MNSKTKDVKADGGDQVRVAFKRWLPVDGCYAPEAIFRPAETAKLAVECNEKLKGFFYVTRRAGTGAVDLCYIVDGETISHFVCEDDDRVPHEVDRLINHTHELALAAADG